MDWSQFVKDLHLVWQYKPDVIILLVVGFLIFLFLVVDVWNHKARHKRRHPPKRWVQNFWHQTRNCRRPSLQDDWRPREEPNPCYSQERV